MATAARYRWGDFSKAQVDPSNDADLWVVNEYAKPVTDQTRGRAEVWGTWWAKVISPILAPVAVAPTSLAGSKVTLVVQRKKGGKRRQVKSTTRTIADDGSYSWKYKPAKRGPYRMRTSSAKTATHAAAATKWRAFKAKKPARDTPWARTGARHP